MFASWDACVLARDRNLDGARSRDASVERRRHSPPLRQFQSRADTTNNIGTPSDAGSAWSQVSGTWGISSNAAYQFNGTFGNVVAALEASNANVDVQVTITTVGGENGLTARLADDNNYLIFIWDASNGLRMFKKVAGSYTQLGSTVAYTESNGDVLKFTVHGSTLNGYVNGALKIGPITDSAGSTNTQHGLFNAGTVDGAASRYDGFSITSN